MTALPVTAHRSLAHAPIIDRDALRDVAPILVSIAPFALVVGVTMAEAGMSAPAGMLAAAMVFAGSAHVAAVTMHVAGAGLAPILLTVAVINARLLLYGAGLARGFRDQPAWFRWLAPQLIVDQTYAIASGRDLSDRARFRRYWLTAGSAVGVVWIAGIGAAMALGPQMPADSPLLFAAPAVFIGLLVPRLVSSPAIRAAAVAAAVAAVASPLTSGVGLLLGVAAGLLAAGRAPGGQS